MIEKTTNDFNRARILINNLRILTVGYSVNRRKNSIIVSFRYYPKLKYFVFIHSLIGITDICGLKYFILSDSPRVDGSKILFIMTTDEKISREYVGYFNVDISHFTINNISISFNTETINTILKKANMLYNVKFYNGFFNINIASERSIVFTLVLFINGFANVNNYNTRIFKRTIGKKQIFSISGQKIK
jgi:hypothetical protein